MNDKSNDLLNGLDFLDPGDSQEAEEKVIWHGFLELSNLAMHEDSAIQFIRLRS